MGGNKPGKVFQLIVDAIRSLDEVRGSTAKEIVKFVSENQTIDDPTVKCIYTSLKRGVDDGCFHECDGRFSLSVQLTPPQISEEKNVVDGEEKEDSGPGKDLDLEMAKSCGRRKRRRSKRRSCGKRRSRRRRSRKRSSRGCGKKRRRRSCSRRRRRSLCKARRSRKRSCRKSPSRRRRSRKC